MLDKGKAFSTIKVYLAARSAWHVGFGNTSGVDTHSFAGS